VLLLVCFSLCFFGCTLVFLFVTASFLCVRPCLVFFLWVASVIGFVTDAAFFSCPAFGVLGYVIHRPCPSTPNAVYFVFF